MCILAHVRLGKLLHAGTGRRQGEPGRHSSATVLQQVEGEKKRVEESRREWKTVEESGREKKRVGESGREWKRVEESGREWKRAGRGRWKV